MCIYVLDQHVNERYSMGWRVAANHGMLQLCCCARLTTVMLALLLAALLVVVVVLFLAVLSTGYHCTTALERTCSAIMEHAGPLAGNRQAQAGVAGVITSSVLKRVCSR
jgi:hypothetical protein